MIYLVPTRVGMILKPYEIPAVNKSCPHTRGDDPSALKLTALLVNLSPHAWG